MNDAWHEEPGAGEDALSRLVEDPDARVAAGARWALGQREQLRDTPVPERRRRRWW